MLIVPKDEVNIIYSNIPEIDENIEVYDNAKTYSLGDIVQFDGSIFESAKDENIDTPVNKQSSLSWFYIGATNRYKMFDEYIDTLTQNKNIIEYELLVNDIDTICFFNLDAFFVEVELYNKQGLLIYQNKKSTYTRDVSNWYEWTVIKSREQKTLFFNNLPFGWECILKVKISKEQDITKCGLMTFGRSLDLGLTLAEPKPISSIRNTTTKERLKDGSLKFINSRVYKRVVLNVIVSTSRVAQIQAILEQYSNQPLLFIGVEKDDENLNILSAFGFFKDFDKPIGLNFTQYQIEIEGIV